MTGWNIYQEMETSGHQLSQAAYTAKIRELALTWKEMNKQEQEQYSALARLQQAERDVMIHTPLRTAVEFKQAGLPQSDEHDFTRDCLNRPELHKWCGTTAARRLKINEENFKKSEQISNHGLGLQNTEFAVKPEWVVEPTPAELDEILPYTEGFLKDKPPAAYDSVPAPPTVAHDVCTTIYDCCRKSPHAGASHEFSKSFVKWVKEHSLCSGCLFTLDNERKYFLGPVSPRSHMAILCRAHFRGQELRQGNTETCYSVLSPEYLLPHMECSMSSFRMILESKPDITDSMSIKVHNVRIAYNDFRKLQVWVVGNKLEDTLSTSDLKPEKPKTQKVAAPFNMRSAAAAKPKQCAGKGGSKGNTKSQPAANHTSSLSDILTAGASGCWPDDGSSEDDEFPQHPQSSGSASSSSTGSSTSEPDTDASNDVDPPMPNASEEAKAVVAASQEQETQFLERLEIVDRITAQHQDRPSSPRRSSYFGKVGVCGVDTTPTRGKRKPCQWCGQLVLAGSIRVGYHDRADKPNGYCHPHCVAPKVKHLDIKGHVLSQLAQLASTDLKPEFLATLQEIKLELERDSSS